MRAVIDKQIDELLRDGRIEPSKSPHSAPIVIAAKKNGDVRMCVDYRQLNENSVPDAYPLPRFHQILERLRNAKFISTLDLKNGYWQIPRHIGYLGHVISEAGIHTDPDKVAAIRELKPPTCLKELRKCLGISSCNRVAQRYYWPGLIREVARYVRHCPSCQRFKTSQEKPTGKMFTRQVEEPFHVLCAEFVGPLPRSKQENTVLLVFPDAFSK
ncbi:hypothetical protein KR054_008814, partial [Drosophila jambulina]